MIGYKLTDQDMRTMNDFQWELNVAKNPEPTNFKEKLCGPGWLHFYKDPLIGLFLNPSHARIDNPRIFECLCEGEILHEPSKSGCTQMTLLKELDVPKITIEQRIKFGILCALEVCKGSCFVDWASKWLDGSDRSKEAAEVITMRNSLYNVYNVVYHAAYAALFPNNELGNASYYSSRAANNAGDVIIDIDFIKLAQQAMKI